MWLLRRNSQHHSLSTKHSTPTYPISRTLAKTAQKFTPQALKTLVHPITLLWLRARPTGSVLRSARPTDQCIDQRDARRARRSQPTSSPTKNAMIKYADRWTIAWKCVLDDNNNVTDLLPARMACPTATRRLHTTYPLASFPERGTRERVLSDVAADAVRAFHARQLERAGEDIRALEQRGVLRGVVVSGHRTEVVCDVYEARGGRWANRCSDI